MKTASCHQTSAFPRVQSCIALIALCLTARVTAADLSVSITSSPDPAVSGSELTYTITVSNAGPAAATGVVVTNKLSEGQSLEGPGAGTCPEPGPVAWWQAEGEPVDRAGSNDGTLQGDATYVAGKAGLAFSLDGVGDYVRFPDSPALRPASFTIEGWFQPAELSGIRILVSKTFGGSSSVNDSFAIFLNAGRLNALVPRAGGGFDTLSVPTAVMAGEWYHIAYTFDDPANTHTLYLNGIAVASGTSTTTLPYDSNPVLIGADIERGAPSFFYSGLADEVTIYNYALGADQILAIHDADSLGKCRAPAVFLLAELPSQSSTNFSLTVRPVLCAGFVTNVVCVAANEPDPNPDNDAATNIVSVLDGIDPEIACATDKAVECGTDWDFDAPVASDACGEVTVSVVGTVTNSAGFCGQTFEATRTWEAMDLAGNGARCSQTVVVMDTTPPSIVCEQDKEASCEDPEPFDEPVFSDTCGEATLAVLGTTTNLMGAGFLELIRTWQAVDSCGNSAQCTQTVLLQDLMAPECAEDKTVECGSAWDFDLPIDACSAVTATVLNTITNTTGFCGGGFEATRTWEAVDSAGNTNECSQTVTAVDMAPPVCASDKTVECGSEWDFDDPVDGCGGVTVTVLNTITNLPGICGQTFEATRTWEATDDCGNMVQCSQTVTVSDSTPPTIVCAENKTVECPGSWDFDEPAADDGCGMVTLTLLSTVTNSAGFCGATFEAVRTWEALDECGNSAQCAQTVTVVDTTPPSVTCAEDITVTCESPWEFDGPVAEDGCGTVTVTILSTTTNAVGEGVFHIVRTWEAADDCGNTAQCGQIAVVQDATPPAITCANPKTVECGEAWDFDAPSASDSCGEVTIGILGIITNALEFCGQTVEATWEATDSAGNTVRCSQTVTLTDSTPPTITCIEDKTVGCAGPWEFDEPSAADNCGTATLAVLTTVTNSSPTGGYTATRTWQATDDCGNASECSQMVSVLDVVPELSIALHEGAGMVRLCWPAACSESVLEFTTNLDGTGTWLEVEEAPTAMGMEFCVDTPVAGSTRYYRLRREME